MQRVAGAQKVPDRLFELAKSGGEAENQQLSILFCFKAHAFSARVCKSVCVRVQKENGSSERKEKALV